MKDNIGNIITKEVVETIKKIYNTNYTFSEYKTDLNPFENLMIVINEIDKNAYHQGYLDCRMEH